MGKVVYLAPDVLFDEELYDKYEGSELSTWLISAYNVVLSGENRFSRRVKLFSLELVLQIESMFFLRIETDRCSLSSAKFYP